MLTIEILSHYSSRDAGPRDVRTERTSDQRSLAGNGPGRQTTDQTMGKSGENLRRAQNPRANGESLEIRFPSPRNAPRRPHFTLHKLWGLAGLEFASQLAGHCAAAAKRDDSPPRPAPHRVLNNAHYRDIESLFKSRRGAAECPDRKDERSEIARGERSGTTDDRPDNGQKW